jgi:polyisoprenoid-binding protein YceI
MKKTALIIILSLFGIYSYSQKDYAFDRSHARLSFSAVHFGISNVEGNFKNFDVMLKAGKDDFTDAEIEVTADISSINTENDMRDNDLKNESWFNAEKFPKLTFKSTAFKKLNDKKYVLEGNITMKGTTKPIKLDVIYNGRVQNPYSKKYMYGFTITGKLNRTDFKVGTSTLANVVGEQIEIKSNVEFVSEK